MKSKNIIILDTETTGTKFPRRFKNIIKLKKRKDIYEDIPDKFHY